MRNQNKSMYNEKQREELVYSIKNESIVVTNILNKTEFINLLNEIYLNSKGKNLEIEGLNLTKLKNLITGYLKIDLDLPFTIQIRKLKKIMSPKQGDNKHLHGLTSENIYNALLNLNEPNIITRHEGDSNNITLFTEIKNKDCENIIIGFTFFYNFNLKKTQIKVNNIETMYGISSENEKIYQENGRLGKRIVIYNKRSGWLVPITPTTTSNYSICKKGKDVNENVKSDIDSTLKDSINKKRV